MPSSCCGSGWRPETAETRRREWAMRRPAARLGRRHGVHARVLPDRFRRQRPAHLLRTCTVSSTDGPRSAETTPASTGEQIASTVDLVKAYAQQETLDHFKGMGKWVGFGIVGATCLSIGIVLLVLGLLRLLQSAGDDVFYGFWSIVPYLIALIVCAMVVALALSRVQATDVHRQAKKR